MTSIVPVTIASGTRTYALTKAWGIAACLLGVLLAAVGIAGTIRLAVVPDVLSPYSILLPFVICLGCTALGAYIVAYALTFKVTLHPDWIEARTPARARHLSRDDIEGFRLFTGGVYDVLILVEKRSGRWLRMPCIFNRDVEFRAWIAPFSDLAEFDRQQGKAQVAADSRLGQTPQERFAKVARARWKSGALGCIAFFPFIWLFVDPSPYRSIIFLVAILPWLLMLAARILGVHQIFGRYPGYPNPAPLYLLPSGVVLFVRVLEDVNLIDVDWALLACLIGTFALYPIVRRVMRNGVIPAQFAAMLIFAGLYGVGLTLHGNWFFDKSTPMVFRMQVLTKLGSDRLKVGPWGPYEKPNKVAVAKRRHRSIGTSDTVCIYLMPGAFGVRWYYVRRCR